MKNVKSRGAQHVFVAALVAWLLALTGTQILSPAGVSDSIWPGHATFLVPSSYDLAELDAALISAGIASYIGAATTQFEFNDFGPLSTVKLTELTTRFDRRDPRLDPYMQSVGNYFKVQEESVEYHVIYVPGDAAALIQSISPVLRERGIPLMSADTGAPDGMFLPFLVFCAVGGATALSRRRRPFVFAAGLLLFVVTVRTLDPFGTAAGLLLYLSWVMSYPRILTALSAGAISGQILSTDMRVRSVFRLQVAYLAASGALAVALVLWHSPQAVLGLIITIVAVCAAAAAGIALERRRVTIREHGVFEPVAILPRRLRPQRLSRDLYLAPLGALLVLLLVPTIGHETELSVPALPQPVNSAEDDGEALSSVDAAHLPTIEDYLAHRAFQVAFMYGWEFRLPERGEDVRIPEFERNNGRIERRDRVAFTFDQEWIDAELDAIRENGSLGVESMLLAAGSPDGVEYRPVRHVYWARSELIRTAILVVLLLLVPAAAHVGALFSVIDTGDRVTHLFYKRRNIEVV